MEDSRQRQMSEAFITSAFLAFSGGFQDAYTYNCRDNVFSNAQTGNVVLMSQHLMLGQWVKAVQYLLPIFAFALGVFVTERVQERFRNTKKIHWRQGVVFFEIVILLLVGFIPADFNMIATMLVSFSCAMQVQAFKKVDGFSYASTMCIGNLRSGTEALSCYMRDREPKKLSAVRHYYGIIFIFAVGAGIGGVVSMHLGLSTVWICCVILFIVLLLMGRRTTNN